MMRPEPNVRIEAYRAIHPVLGSSEPGVNWGYFRYHGMDIISSGSHEDTEWEHVSVSRPNRCPTWNEMACVKELFWGEDETVLQFHPKIDFHVNKHQYCLHLWRRRGQNAELPPLELI